MAPGETVPYPHWDTRWYSSPYAVSLAAGAFAGLAAEVLLFPLDCLKTRAQSKQGFAGMGRLRGLYRGCGTAMCGSVPASAIFWSTYEFVKGPGGLGINWTPDEHSGVPQLRVAGTVMLASAVSELTAAFVRVPVDLVKQRLQAGYQSSFALPLQTSVLLASFQATALRDIAHSSLQFPIYEYLKACARAARKQRSGAGREDPLPHYLTALFGSVAGVISAVLTTPFDLVKTRLNLRTQSSATGGVKASGWSLLADEVSEIFRAKGIGGFFVGATYRAAWMGLGGFIYLGSFEYAKDSLAEALSRKAPPGLREPEAEPWSSNNQPPKDASIGGREARAPTSASVSFTAGLVAGVAVDVPLHPVDTLKTRMQTREGLAAGAVRKGLWNGLSAVLVMSLPGSAIFFLVYDQAQAALQHTPFLSMRPILVDGASACLADTCACLVRVPCEVMKQRMQVAGLEVAKTASGTDIVRTLLVEGPRGFYAGFNATVCREVPFALIQMPLFEELKQRHPWNKRARATGDTSLHGVVGMTSGAVAGAIAGFITTPLDTAKTRLMLTERSVERRGLVETLVRIGAESGAKGLFSGVAPRTLHSCAGGALWLGAFEWSKLLLSRARWER